VGWSGVVSGLAFFLYRVVTTHRLRYRFRYNPTAVVLLWQTPQTVPVHSAAALAAARGILLAIAGFIWGVPGAGLFDTSVCSWPVPEELSSTRSTLSSAVVSLAPPSALFFTLVLIWQCLI
jgi:hypothetical protein